jgi:hypothetical protein
MSKRTAKDEQQYDEQLRREMPIVGEVLSEFRRQNSELWKSQVDLLRELIAANEALLLYRRRALENSARALTMCDDVHHCVPGCTRHEWRDRDGWHRAAAKEQA